ncbi:MAG: hypothetical protein IH788_04590 [Nitrospinae bacterium]|nr:hypothetical protein [Nitrospinota bacterium]
MAQAFEVSLKITGREEVSSASVRAERALARLGERGSQALQRISVVGTNVKRSLEAIDLAASIKAASPALQQMTNALAGETAEAIRLASALGAISQVSRQAAVAQSKMASSINQSTAALNRIVASARRAASALGEFGAVSFTTALTGAQLRARFDAQFSNIGIAQHGAVTTQPTLLMTSERGQAELVVPFSRAERSPEVQRAFDELAAREGGGGSEITIVVPVNLDGRQIAKVVARHQRRGAA